MSFSAAPAQDVVYLWDRIEPQEMATDASQVDQFPEALQFRFCFHARCAHFSPRMARLIVDECTPYLLPSSTCETPVA